MVELIQKEIAFLPACMSDIGGFISVVIVVTQNYLRNLDSKLVVHKGGTSSIKCSERTCKEGELGLCGITARLDILVISKIKSPVAANVFCGKKGAKLSCNL